MISKEELIHNGFVDKLKKRPSLINLEGIAMSTGESIIFRKDELIYREPDGLMFDPATHTLYNIEYKTNHNQNTYQKAKIQLRTSREKLNKIFGEWEVRNLYISGPNFDIRELK